MSTRVLEICDTLISIFTQSTINNNSNNTTNDTKAQLLELERVWKRYPDISNYSSKFRRSLDKWGHTNTDIEWVVTEKVHGANFAIMTDGKHFLAAKRNSILRSRQKFFTGWHSVVQKHKSRMLQALKLIQNMIDHKIRSIVIYGELFGGWYPHSLSSSMTIKQSLKPIQKQILYSPDLNFYAFDIRIKSNANIGKRLPFQYTLKILKECNFLFCEPLMRGTFDECLKFDVDSFVSTIPSKLGLHEPYDDHQRIENNENVENECKLNIAEGIVLRKLHERHAITKIKCQKYCEKQNVRKLQKRNGLISDNLNNGFVDGYEYDKFRKKQKRAKRNQFKGCLSKNDDKKILHTQLVNEMKIDQSLLIFIESCVNENRYQSVLNKIDGGLLRIDNFSKVKGIFVSDVWTELKKVYFVQLEKIRIEIMYGKPIGPLKKYCHICVNEFCIPKLRKLERENTFVGC